MFYKYDTRRKIIYYYEDYKKKVKLNEVRTAIQTTTEKNNFQNKKKIKLFFKLAYVIGRKFDRIKINNSINKKFT